VLGLLDQGVPLSGSKTLGADEGLELNWDIE